MGLLWFRDLEKKQTKWYSKNWQLRVTKKCSWCWGSVDLVVLAVEEVDFEVMVNFACHGEVLEEECSKCDEKGQVKK